MSRRLVGRCLEIGSWVLEVKLCAREILEHLLHPPLPLALANVAGGDVRIVLEEDQVLAIDRVADQPLLEGQRVQRKKVVAGHPWVLQVRGGRDDVGREY